MQYIQFAMARKMLDCLGFVRGQQEKLLVEGVMLTNLVFVDSRRERDSEWVALKQIEAVG